MAVVLTYSMGVPVMKVGRLAGQFAKPRSSDFETIDGEEILAFRGHIVNGDGATAAARIPQPDRLVQAYHQSASTLNLVRAFTKGGFAALDRVHAWTQEFVASSPSGQRYEQLATEIDRALRFMRATGMDTESNSNLREVDVWTSHEALLLSYEEALTRRDSTTGNWYDCSAHMLWIGERTRELDVRTVEFLRGVGNPIGVKVGPSMTGEDVIALCEALNPVRIPGRLTLISRMGADQIVDRLRPLLRSVKESGHPVVWACDPMHGNTYTNPNGRKTRSFDAVIREIEGFVQAHRIEGTWPGGIHIELTGSDVTECIGGADELQDSDLDHRYETVCDPRLNGRQALELAFRTAELIRADSNG
jgi:3-deoxy-7-phosphoheptulonate synthase